MKTETTVAYTELTDIDKAGASSNTAQIVAPVDAWPSQPKPLTLTRKEQVLWTAFDATLIALPVALIVKTGLCIYAHHKDESNFGTSIDSASLLSQGLVQFNQQLVTLFTIVFVTIVSTFVKRLALWKAQRGAYLSDLEQLQGSVSLPSTLKLIWSLRSFGLNSILLAAVWSFYYLGSQAVKLEYRLTISDDHQNFNAAIQKSNAPSYFSTDLANIFNKNNYNLLYFNKQGAYLDRLNTNFGAIILDQEDASQSLHGQQQNPGTRDGAQIPDFYLALGSVPQTSWLDKLWHKRGGWIDTSIQSRLGSGGNYSYVSYVGQYIWLDYPYYDSNKTLMHSPVSEPFLGTYTLYNTSYLNVSCGLPTISSMWSFPNGTTTNTSVSFNITSTRSDAAKDKNGYPLRELSYWRRGFTRDRIDGVNLTAMFLSGQVDNNTYNYTQKTFQSICNVTTKYVDMQVRCITTGCYPSRLRWANNTSEYNATGYSTAFDDDTFATNFLSNFTVSTGAQSDWTIRTLMEGEFLPDWFNDTFWSDTNGTAQNNLYGYDFTSTVQEEISPPLSKGINTYYMLSQGVVADYIQPNMTTIDASSKQEDDIFRLVEAKGAALSQAYRIYWRWIPVDFTACGILLAAAIGSCWLRINTLAPDVFGYVSSLTRDNGRIPLPTEGSTLSGIDRARRLKRVKVRIGEVQGVDADGSTIGMVGLAPVNAEVRPLHSQRVYI